MRVIVSCYGKQEQYVALQKGTLGCVDMYSYRLSFFLSFLGFRGPSTELSHLYWN